MFAGFGAAGALLAAVGAAFVIAGGVLAFDQWPAGLADPPAGSVQVAAAEATARPVVPETFDLPAAAAPGPGAGGAITGTNRGRTPGDGDDGSPPRTTPPGSEPAPTPPGTPPGGGDDPAPPRDTSLAATVESATSATADGVRSVGQAVPLAAPVTDLVGGLVDSTGRTVGGLLRG